MIAKSKSTPKKGDTVSSVGKVMTTAFWDTHDIVFIDYSKKGTKITGKYCASLFEQLKAEMAKNGRI